MLTWNVRVLSIALVVALAACGDGVTGPLEQEAAPMQAAFSDDSGIDAGSLASQEASVVTDKDDYQPGDTVTITGTGWEPGETVHIHIEEDPETDHNPHDFYVQADEDGAFTHRDLVMDEDHLGVTFTLTATGESSGKVAEWTFTDGFPGPNHLTITVAQDPNPVAPGAVATYTLELEFNGRQGSCTVDLTFTPTTSPAWPSGYSASFSNPSLVEDDVESSELTIDVPSDAPSATYGFTIGIAYPSGHGCQSTSSSPTASGALIVASPTASDTPTTTTVSDTTATYGVETVTLTAIVSGTPGDVGEVTFTLKDGTTTIGTPESGDLEDGEASVSYAIPAGTGAGTYSIEASYGGAPGFASSDADPGTLTIDPLEITGSFTADNKVYDGNVLATVLTRSVTGALAGDDVSLVGGSATFEDKNVGTNKVVTLSGAGLEGDDADNYTLGSDPITTFADITALEITGSFTADDKVYDGNDSATVLTTSLSGLIDDDDVTLGGGTATFDDKNVGTGKTVTLDGATLSGDDAGNYSLGSVSTTTADITPLDITGTFTAHNKVYDGTTAATVDDATPDDVIDGDDVTLTNGTATFDTKDVGTGKTVTLTGAVLSGADADNYNLTSVATTTADITPLGIDGGFDAEDKVYDGTTDATASNRSLSGVLGTDEVELTGGTATFDDKNVGTDKTVTLTGATLSGADAGNYELNADPTTTASITPLDITGSFTADDKVYDGTTEATISNRSLSGVLGTDDVSLIGGTATFDDKNVGTGKTVTLSGATLSGADEGNYNLTSVATATADITPAPLTATADDITRNFSDPSPIVLTASYDGFVGGEDANVLDENDPQLLTTAEPGSDAGSYPITWDDPPGVSASNYTITFVDGTLTIIDDVAPVVFDVTLDPTFVMADDGTTTLEAGVDDSATGNSDIAWAEYSIPGLAGWTPMDAKDGAFDSPVEWVTATLGPFSGPTVLDVCVRGSDVAGNVSEEACGFLAVVDPSEGFVTGGGWIDSPPGAYTADPDLVGKANFGFVARYHRGAQTPDGNTQFQFRAADLNFHSTSYEWLVVSGGSGRAQFKGEGRLNGVPGYSFTLTVIDADMSGSNDGDRFRIKITNGTGTSVYDNELGMDDSGDPTTTIGGGSIVIHTGGNGNGPGGR